MRAGKRAPVLDGVRKSAQGPAYLKTRTRPIRAKYLYKFWCLHRGFPGLVSLTRHKVSSWKVSSWSGSSALSHSLGQTFASRRLNKRRLSNAEADQALTYQE